MFVYTKDQELVEISGSVLIKPLQNGDYRVVVDGNYSGTLITIARAYDRAGAELIIADIAQALEEDVRVLNL